MLDLTVGQYVYEMFDDLEDEQEARKQSTLLVKHIVLEGKVHENGRELRLWQIARDVTKMDACWEEFFRKHGYDRKMRSQAKSQAKEALFEWFGAVAKYHQELKWFVDIDLHAIENLSIDCPPGMLSELIKTQRRLSCLFYGQQTKTADGSYTIQKMTGEEYS